MWSGSLFFLFYYYALQHWYLVVVTIFWILFAHYYLKSFFYVHFGLDGGQVLLGNRLLSDPVWTKFPEDIHSTRNQWVKFLIPLYTLLFYVCVAILYVWDWLFNSHGGGNHLILTLINGEIRWFTPKKLILTPVFCWWRRWPCDWNIQSWGHLWPLPVIWRRNKEFSVVPCSSDVGSMWFLKLRFSASRRWGGIRWKAGFHWGRN